MSKGHARKRWGLSAALFALGVIGTRTVLAAPCVDGSTDTQNIDGTSPNPYTCDVEAGSGTTAFGVDSDAGTVFYLVGPPSVSPPGPTCSEVTASEHYTCTNGVTVQAPAGSSAAATSGSTPVAVTINAPGSLSAAETVTFDLTTIDGTSGDEVVRTYQIGLLPADRAYQAIFVLDHSGSMGSSTDSGKTRWQALTEGVNGILPSFNALSPPAGSELGLTLFESTVKPDLLGSDSVTVDASTATTVSNAMPATHSSGATAMGPGLANGIGKFNAPSKNQVILLFTDGLQNVAPLVDSNGTNYSNGDPLNPGGVRIVTVGIDGPEDEVRATLQALADNNDGVFLEVDGTGGFTGLIAGTLDLVFASTIQPILTGNSPQQIATITGSFGDDPEVGPFTVNRDVDHLVFIAFFSRNLKPSEMRPLVNALVVERDGVDITRHVRSEFIGESPSSVTLHVPLNTPMASASGTSDTITIDADGDFTVRFAPWSQEPDPMDYRVVGFADDHRLNIDFDVAETAPQAPGDITPTVRLDWIGVPIEDATVTAMVLRPGGELGDMLANHPLTVDPGSGPDADNPGVAKYNQLMANDAAFRTALGKTENLLTLTHQGDGVYSAPFTTGEVRGSYQILFTVEADDDRYGSIRRSSSLTQYVGYGTPSLDLDAAYTKLIDGGINIFARPLTGYGTLLGPAQQNLFSVTSSDLTLVRTVDLQDGTYRLELSGNPSAEIDISIGGASVYTGPADKITAQGNPVIDLLVGLGLPPWLAWLLLILLVLLAIWILLRLFR